MSVESSLTCGARHGQSIQIPLRHGLPLSTIEPTQAFLRRVGRCFVWGFDPECVILCRGAIETALRDVIDDDLCHRYGQPAARYGYTLAQRINAAESSGILDKDVAKAARRANERATKSAHDNPEATKDALGTIKDTLRVILKLPSRT